ncbi:MAG: hypothetical protein ACD_12C00697G0008 [uncultured bacterium]|nr:MAG: hypothetical protein ACD_12C00697G0008 [uncultured bacterium]
MNKKIFINLILFFLIPVQLLIFTFLIPPFQKPDGQPHFEKSLLISKGYLFCKEKTSNKVKLEKKYADFINTPYLDLMTHRKSAKLPLPEFFRDLFSNNRSNKLVNFNIDHLCSFPIISYIPQAFVLWILSFLNVNPIQSIYIVRLAMSIIGYFWFLNLYRKIAENYKQILLFTFALPMTLHQISSFSYDAMHIMFGLTFFSLIINNLEVSFPRRRESRLSWIPVFTGMTKKYFKLFFILFLFLASKKIGYETFFLFLFLIPFEIKPMIISNLIFIPFYFLSKLTGFYDLQYSLVASTINPLSQINFLISNPVNILIVLFKTTIKRFPFYLQSLIGIFGWLEYGLDPLSYLLYGLFFIYVIVETRHASSLHKNKTILLFLTLIISYIFILLLAFIFNTAPGSLVAHGVQGRYFIPLLPFIILLIVQFTQKIKIPTIIKIGEGQKNIIYILLVGYLIVATFYSVFNRYY